MVDDKKSKFESNDKDSWKKNGRSNNKQGGKGKSNNKYRGKGKGYGKNSKVQDVSKGSIKDPSNDTSWYKLPEQMLFDAASWSYNNPLGAEIPGVVDTDHYKIPGLAAIQFFPTVGEANKINSPINMSANELLAKMRKTVSVKLTFSASDAMMYLLAMDSMYLFYTYCIRIYGYNSTYSGMNWHMPQAMYKAMGLKIDSKTDWNGFRIWLNRWAYKLSQLYVPKDVDYFKRHMFMSANVYLDSPSPKAQAYMFTPTHIYQWKSGGTYGTKLEPVVIPGSLLSSGTEATLEDLQNFGDSVLDALLSDVDVKEFSGMFLRTFGSDNCIALSTIDEQFRLVPQYVPELLLQIHNLTICGAPLMTGGYGTIEQGENDTMSVTYVTIVSNNESLRHMTKNRIVDQEVDSPSADHNFVATRLQAIGKTITSPVPEVTAPDTCIQLTCYGTEVVSKVIVLGAEMIYIINSSTITDTQVTPLVVIAVASQFKSFPLLYSAVKASGAQTHDALSSIIGEVNNETTIEEYALRNIHSAAALKQFSIPGTPN